MQAYGPFSDEQLFYYADKSILLLDQFQLYDSSTREFIGLDDLQVIYNKGKKGNFNGIFFAGIATIDKPDILCQRGFDLIYNAVLERHPSLTQPGFERRCKDGDVVVELYCQLKNMPVAYLTERPANSVLVYSNNLTNFNCQRCYIANTFHIECFSRSEETLQFAMIEKFVIDTSKTLRRTPRAQRDVHWLVDHYITVYKKAFRRHRRPTLHRAVVYDYFAVYAEPLGDIINHKIFTMDISKWRVWVAEAKEYREKAEAQGSDWGTMPLGRAQTLPEIRPDNDEEDEEEEEREVMYGPDLMDIDVAAAEGRYEDFSAESSSESSSSSASSASSEKDVPYTMDATAKAMMQHRLLKRIPQPDWYWECDVDLDCPFVINLSRSERKADAPYMAKLNEKDKNLLIQGSWRLTEPKIRRVWKKICQAHWEEHMEEVGLVVDHVNKSIVLKQGNDI